MSFGKEQLQEGEEVLIYEHPHWLTVAGPMLAGLVGAILAIWLAYYLQAGWPLLVVLLPLIWLGWRLMIRASVEYIVTNHRVVKQTGVWAKDSMDAPMDKINNIFHSQSVVGKLFDYGEVGLETASEMGVTKFESISHPIRFKNVIVAEREKYRGRGPGTSADHPILLLEKLDQLRKAGTISEEEFQREKAKLLK